MPYKNKICGIYCIENKCNYKKYIGQSVNIYERWAQHRSLLRKKEHKNQHLQNAWDIYGEDNFSFYIIEQCSIDKLDERETYYSIFYNVLDKNYGYNIEPTGRANHTLSQETIAKIKANRQYVVSEETKQKISELQTGRKLTEEWKKNISNHHKNAIQNGTMIANIDNLLQYNEKQKVKIDCYNTMGDFIYTYDSINEASRILNIAATNICKVLQGKYRHCAGLVFYHHDGNIIPKYKIISRVYDCPIFSTDNTNHILEFFVSYAEASRRFNVPVGSIRKVCNGQLKQTHGYTFMLATEKMLAEYFDKIKL